MKITLEKLELPEIYNLIIDDNHQAAIYLTDEEAEEFYHTLSKGCFAQGNQLELKGDWFSFLNKLQRERKIVKVQFT